MTKRKILFISIYLNHMHITNRFKSVQTKCKHAHCIFPKDTVVAEINYWLVGANFVIPLA